MLALSVPTLVAQRGRSKIIRWKLSYRRRYWDTDTQAFKLEASATEIQRSQVAAVSPTRDQLDRAAINEFKTSNITIELRNETNEWSPRNPNGKFKPDLVARLGYEPQLMEFALDVFYELEDGTESAAIPLFVGRAVGFEAYPARKVAVVTVESKHILLERANAEAVSTTIVNEVMVGTVDGVNKDFFSAQTGVGRVNAVRLAGLTKKQGVDYTVSQLSVFNQPVKITFTVAPTVLEGSPRIDYLRWLQDQKIDDLVESLGSAAGLLASEMVVDPVIFPNQVLNKRVFTTKTDWDAGVKTDVETDTSPGDVKIEGMRIFDDFNDGSYLDGSPRSWDVAFGAFGQWYISAGTLYHTGFFTNAIHTPSALAYGTWEIKMALTANTGQMYFFFMNTSTDFQNPTGYSIRLSQSVVGQFLALNRLDGSGIDGTVLAQALNSDDALHTIRITRSPSGEFKIYFDNSPTPLFTVTDNTHVTSTHLGMIGTSSVDKPFDDIRVSPGVLPAPQEVLFSSNIVTQAIDAGVGNPQAWGLLERIESLPSGTSIAYETATSIDNIIYDPFVAVGAGGQIQSAIKRYLKTRTLFSAPSGTASPVLSELVINWTTSTTLIKMANFLGLTVLEAIKRLGEIANYEWGFSRDGKLFFRARAYDPNPDLVVNLKNLKQFSRVTDGVDRVFNEIRATYGGSEKIVNPTTQNDSRPTSIDRYGTLRLSIGGGQILIDPDADIATGLAIGYFNLFKKPRPVFEIVIDFTPQLELADTLLLQVADAEPDPKWHVGDSSRFVGDTRIRLYGHEQQSAFDILGRVLSAGHDIGAMDTRLVLEEIR